MSLVGLDAGQGDRQGPARINAGDLGCLAPAHGLREASELGRIGITAQLHVAAHRSLGAPRRRVVGHGGEGGVPRAHHARGAEDLGPHVVAVDGREVRFGGGNGSVVELDHHYGRVQQARPLKLRGDQGIGRGVDFHGLRARIEPVKGIEVVDEGLGEDRLGGHRPGVGQAGIARERPQQLRRADAAGGDHVVRLAESAHKSTIEADLKRQARRPCRGD